MNVVDYFFKSSRKLNKDFIAGVEEKISFKDLYSQVNNLAAILHEKLGSNKEILLLSENNLFYIISYLAIIKSKNIAVLIETRISETDLKELVDQCSLKAFFIQEKKRNKLKLKRNVFTESFLENLPQKREKFEVKTDDNDLAVIIFTSGSTGKKKGVMLTHKNLRANTESIIKYLRLTKKDCMEVVLPFFYVYGASLLHTHLRAGASLVLNKGIFLNCLKDINRFKCTGFAGVPSTFQILVNKSNFLQRKFPKLKYMTQAGGKLANKFILQITNAFPKKKFFVMYGATEASARLSYLPPNLIKKKLGSIGKGIPGVVLKVLNKKGNSVKPGQVGELTAKGNNIMKGYYKNPKETKKVLKNGRYYTGDLARIDKQGFIYVVGRKDHMIKSAGYLISPHEIENIINSVKGVLNNVVVGIPDDLLGEAIAVAVEVKKKSNNLKKKIIDICNKKLPSYKVPKKVVFFDQLPLNSSYKIDMRKIIKCLKNS